MKQKRRAVMFRNFGRLIFLWILSLAAPAFAAQVRPPEIPSEPGPFFDPLDPLTEPLRWPVDMRLFFARDNRPWSNIGITTGNAEEVANQLGVTRYQVIPGIGTIFRVPGDLQTVEGSLRDIGVRPDFAENDFCMNMTPLTAFRGHDHESHIQSNRAIHDHEAPDPPWTWGVTPPETLIRWENK